MADLLYLVIGLSLKKPVEVGSDCWSIYLLMILGFMKMVPDDLQTRFHLRYLQIQFHFLNSKASLAVVIPSAPCTIQINDPCISHVSKLVHWLE